MAIGVIAAFLVVSVPLAFGDPIPQEARDGVGYPLLILSFLVGLYDVTTRKPSLTAVIAVLLGVFGALVVGFDATREALKEAWAEAFALVAAVLGLGFLGAFTIRFFLNKRRAGA